MRENLLHFPDAAHNQAYVGGPHEYQAYQQLRAANNIAQENLETAEMYQDAVMNWGAWGAVKKNRSPKLNVRVGGNMRTIKACEVMQSLILLFLLAEHRREPASDGRTK